MTMKSKVNRVGDTKRGAGYDSCQTPPHAIESLRDLIPLNWRIWECAMGKGNLARAFQDVGYNVIGSDILTGINFFEQVTEGYFDVIVTNPPYSVKYQWLQRCYEIGKPFALLMPVEMLGAQKAQKLFVKYGIELTFLPRRVNFEMPYKGFEGTAQFPVAWYTWKLSDKPMRFWGYGEKDEGL